MNNQLDEQKKEYERMKIQLDKWNFNRVISEENAVLKFWKLKAMFDKEKSDKKHLSRNVLETTNY